VTAGQIILIGACVSAAVVGLALIVGQLLRPRDRTGWKRNRP
jgi:hypothetical protein